MILDDFLITINIESSFFSVYLTTYIKKLNPFLIYDTFLKSIKCLREMEFLFTV